MTQEVEKHIKDLKKRKEGIENVLKNLALMPDEIKTYMEDLADINRELLCYKMIKNYY